MCQYLCLALYKKARTAKKFHIHTKYSLLPIYGSIYTLFHICIVQFCYMEAADLWFIHTLFHICIVKFCLHGIPWSLATNAFEAANTPLRLNSTPA
jgi:hypothetical protein